MLFKRSFGLARSLFILYVHEHDRLGFGTLTVETAVTHLFILIVPIATEKVSRNQLNIIWNRRKSTLRARSIHVNLNQARGNTRISRTAEFVYNK